ncbi:MAG: arginine--tRNA ligase [Mariniblastus sp.]
MNPLSEIKSRFSAALTGLSEDTSSLLAMIRPAGDPKFGDYQANCAMPLGKKLGKSPRDVAADLVAQVSLDDFCQTVEIAGPGFINLKLDNEWIKSRLAEAITDERLGVAKVAESKVYVIDYSSPNVAKPMHVGHIRSTVIGDAITNVLRFVGHTAISDNHLGDWGTQFGMIIYGFKNFVNKAAYEKEQVKELARLYKYVRVLMDYHAAVKELPVATAKLKEAEADLAELQGQPMPEEKSAAKKTKKEIKKAEKSVKSLSDKIGGLTQTIEAVETEPSIKADAGAHLGIATAVLTETAKLHEGDEENTGLWREFLPCCLDDIQRIYDRLSVKFDHVLGESFYHPELQNVVNDLEAKGFTRESDGAVCVFLDGYETPMIVRKQDGAFLYSTTDLATIKHRIDEFSADAMLYVVDHRQHEHFEKLFDVARLWGHDKAEMKHVSFGTVMGKDGKPFKTRSGDTVGLEGLLDEAECRALNIVKEKSSDLPEDQMAKVASVVGLGGLKYADLAHNRESDYTFDYEKMLALKGNTAAYSQYGYARVQGIMRKAEVAIDPLRKTPVPFLFETDVERKLAVQLVQFGETLDEVLVDYKPNLLCTYLFELGQTFAQFFDQCSVKDAESEELKQSRVQLCDLTARTIKTGLGLLGISVLDQM